MTTLALPLATGTLWTGSFGAACLLTAFCGYCYYSLKKYKHAWECPGMDG